MSETSPTPSEEEDISFDISDYTIDSLFHLFNLDKANASYKDVIVAANMLKIRSNELKNQELYNFIQDAEQQALRYLANPAGYISEEDDEDDDEGDEDAGDGGEETLAKSGDVEIDEIGQGGVGAVASSGMPAVASTGASTPVLSALGNFQTATAFHSPFSAALPSNSYTLTTPLAANSSPAAVALPLDRTQQLSMTDDQHAVLQQRPLPIPQHFQVPIIQGQLNPNHDSLVQRLINIDSQFRPSLYDNPADFTLDLSEPLVGVTQLTLSAIEVPHSWYAFDASYGTTTFYIDSTAITIPAGNYTATELQTAIQTALSASFPSVSCAYSSATSRITFTNAGGSAVDLTFYDPSGALAGLENAKENHSLGWLLGFRTYGATIASGGGTLTGSGLIDTYGTRYLVLVIDDFNRNRLNKGLITISEGKDFFRLPSYYNCDTASGATAGLTQAQQYTITQIQTAQATAQANRFGGVQTSDVFARIPVSKTANFQTLIMNDQSLKDNTRHYFGPVDVKRLRVTLMNDKGQVLNLNGMDYSFSVISTHLYQY